MNTRSGTIGSHMRIALAACVISLLIFGCGSAAPSNNARSVLPAPSATPGRTSTPTPTPVSTASPTEAPTPTEATELADAPAIPGLHTDAENGVVVYRADGTNPYGLKKDVYAGQIIENVTVNGAKAKAEAFTIPVLTKLFPAAIANAPDKWLVLPPHRS
jgi:hypothetical protein